MTHVKKGQLSCCYSFHLDFVLTSLAIHYSNKNTPEMEKDWKNQSVYSTDRNIHKYIHARFSSMVDRQLRSTNYFSPSHQSCTEHWNEQLAIQSKTHETLRRQNHTFPSSSTQPKSTVAGKSYLSLVKSYLSESLGKQTLAECCYDVVMVCGNGRQGRSAA